MGWLIIGFIGLVVSITFATLLCADVFWRHDVLGFFSIILATVGTIMFVISLFSAPMIYFEDKQILREYYEYSEFLHSYKNTDISQAVVEHQILEYNSKLAENKASHKNYPFLYWKSKEISNLQYLSLEELNEKK